MSTTLLQSDLFDLPLQHRGKVRDVYDLPRDRLPPHLSASDCLLIVATDRVSAFDLVLPDPIPGKGEVLCQISNFWFQKTAHVMQNHLIPLSITSVLPSTTNFSLYQQRSMIVRKLKPLPIEAIARGYLIGSGWKDYMRTGKVNGIELPNGLQQAERLPDPIFTPSTKAPAGTHDENIDFDTMVHLVGGELAERVRDATLRLYSFAAKFAADRGIILADTKFEFGTDADGRLFVMDEMLTPDSSRYWPASQYHPGISPSSFDKQIIRDYLESIGWNKQAPAPALPPHIIDETSRVYHHLLRQLTS